MATLPQSPPLWQDADVPPLGVYGSVMNLFDDFSQCTKSLQIPHFQERLPITPQGLPTPFL